MSEALRLWSRRIAAAGGLAPGSTLLDVGGGCGELAAAVAGASGCSAVCVDPGVADFHPGINGTTACAESLPFPAGSFDAVLLSHALHHCACIPQTLSEAARVLKPGGRLLIRTASHADLRAAPQARFTPRLLDMQLGSIPDVPELEDAMRSAGLRLTGSTSFETPCESAREALAEAVAFQAWREWAMFPTHAPDPRAAITEWAMALPDIPPIRETLMTAVAPASAGGQE